MKLRMVWRYVVFFSIASLLFGSIHYWIWARLIRDAGWPAPWSRVLTIILGALFFLLIGGFIVARTLPRAISGPIVWISYTWLGVLFFLFLALTVTELGRFIALRPRDPGVPLDPERRLAISRMFAGGAALIGLGVSGAGVASALSSVSVSKIKVALRGLGEKAAGTRIVQLSDVHVGPTIGKEFIEQIVARVNSLDADVVAITGDLVDGSVHELREHVAPLRNIKAKHGVYFVTGNHEYYAGADEWIAHLETLGIKVLRNERVRIGGDDGFDLAGVDDMSAKGWKGHGSDLKRALEGRDRDRACVLLAHQPRAAFEADEHGVDLQLSGHTHGGQMFPWNFMVRLQQPFIAGLHRLARTQVYVSRGTGYWGPPMRVAAPAEITEIELISA